MVVLIVLNILSIFVCFYLAKLRHARRYYWALLGALLGPLAIPFVFFAKPVSEQER
ncbi:hypothetical protein [Thalassotalea sp. PLHSN55]|uniref:hypothetical protein n=1 Tax=Thalassotalea sp. PLHSN55 TaxID=3435888 RepID=UPI003F83AC48